MIEDTPFGEGSGVVHVKFFEQIDCSNDSVCLNQAFQPVLAADIKQSGPPT